MTKRVLITGQNSYIGNSFYDYCEKNDMEFQLDKISVRDDQWRSEDFSKYESVFHVAGIAHNSSDANLEGLYYEVNRDLTIEVAEKAKNEGVKQFVYMSSIIVYGNSKSVIDENSEVNPDNFYGDSKVQAESGLQGLASRDFQVALIRPPMVYGKGSKGNYPLLAKLAQKTPVFPDYKNKRSMLHIDNLSELIRLVIEQEESGVFYPQNAEYVNTSELVKTIAELHRHKIWFMGLGNFMIDHLSKIELVQKVFGDLYYEQEMSHHFGGKYQVNDLRRSIELTEN